MGDGLQKILEADLIELIEMDLSLSQIKDPFGLIYAKAMIAYFQCDIESLKKLIDEIDEKLIISDLIKLRLSIRLKSIKLEEISNLDKHLNSNPIWDAEIFMVQGMAYEKLDEDQKAKELYEKAHHAFLKINYKRKAVKALLNSIAAESRTSTSIMMLPKYFYLYKLALSAGSITAAAKCLLNISKEYWQLNAFSISLAYANEGLKLFNNSAGTIDYYLAIIHRAHLHLELSQPKEALLDYEAVKISQFVEVKAALSVLELAFEKKYPNYINENFREKELNRDHLLYNWKERLERICGKDTIEELGQLEQRLLQILTEGAIDKFELVKRIYGEAKNITPYENRLKNLLLRIRKRFPELILFNNGKYLLAQDGYKLPGVAV